MGVSTYNYYSGATITKNENNVVIDENSNPTNTNGTDGVIQKSRKENDVVTNKNNTPSSLNGTESSTKNKGTNILNDTESNSKNQIVSSGLDQQNSKSNGISSDNKKEKNKRTIATVSYTHLDVYKRQVYRRRCKCKLLKRESLEYRTTHKWL